jgi:NTP pyrophosphatase (non-canonical NTP hydrolase)
MSNDSPNETAETLTLADYQKQARWTTIYSPAYAGIYPAIGLAGETGELLNIIKKTLRDNQGHVTDESREKIFSEIGDVLWYLSSLCTDYSLSLAEVAQSNLNKLRDRESRGVLGGSGDNR